MNRRHAVPGWTRLFDLGRVLDTGVHYRKRHWQSLERSFRSLATSLGVP